MRQGWITLLQLTGAFLLTDLYFNYTMLSTGDGDYFGTTIKTVGIVLLIFLFTTKLTWAKWALSVSLVLYGIICVLVGLEFLTVFIFIGFFDIFFGIYIHRSPALAAFRRDTIKATQIVQQTKTTVAPIPTLDQSHQYPRIVKRYKALLIDGLLVFFTLIVIMIIVQDSDIRTPVMVTSGLTLYLTYEPFLTAYSKTIGQRLMRIKVRSHQNPEKRITLLNAYIRWFVKGLFGWISFVTIHSNPERRAIHDLASDSVMLNDDLEPN